MVLGDLNKDSFNGDLDFESILKRKDYKAWCSILPSYVDICNLKDTIVDLNTQKSIMIIRWNPYLGLYIAESFSDILKNYIIKTSQGVELTEDNIDNYLSKNVKLDRRNSILEAKFYKLLFLVRDKSVLTYVKALVNTEKGRAVMVKDDSPNNYKWNRTLIQEFMIKYDYSFSTKFNDLLINFNFINNNTKPLPLTNDNFSIETISTESGFGGNFTLNYALNELRKTHKNIILSNLRMELSYKNNRFGYWAVYDGIEYGLLNIKSKVYLSWTGQNNYMSYNSNLVIIIQ